MDALRTAAPLARVLLALGEAGRAGEITVEQRARKARLRVVAGRLVALTGVDVEPLGDGLLALGVLDVAAQRALLLKDRTRLSNHRGRSWDGLALPAPGAPSMDGLEQSSRSADSFLERARAPIGARLIAAGVASPVAIALALQRQRLSGLSALLRWPAARVEFSPGEGAAPAAGASIDLGAAVWSVLFTLACQLPAPALAQLAGDGELVLSEAGQRRVGALRRACERGELAALTRLAACGGRLGASSLQVEARAGAGERNDGEARAAAGERSDVEVRAGASERNDDEARAAARERNHQPPSEAVLARALAARPAPELHAVRALLRVLGAALVRPLHDEACALLLRKSRELARNVSARRLLDLPEQAGPAHARQALRRLAQQLHPDRFQARDARLHAISTEVMGALASAELELRSATDAHHL